MQYVLSRYFLSKHHPQALLANQSKMEAQQQNAVPKSAPATPSISLPDILTAQPSRAIVKFKEGKQEIGLRGFAIVSY